MTNINLQQSLGQILSLLDEFANDSGFLSRMTTVFSPEKAKNITLQRMGSSRLSLNLKFVK